jgi:hypothetical protein
MKGLHRKTLSGWEPIDESAKKIHKRYKVGEEAELENKKKRNIRFHRKYFGVLDLTFNNQDMTDNREEFREAVQIHAGFYHYQKLIDGSEVKRSDSISFEKMDDITFSDLYNKVFNVCLKILGCKSEELEMELLRFD